MTFYDRHKYHKISFYDIYDGHKVSQKYGNMGIKLTVLISLLQINTKSAVFTYRGIKKKKQISHSPDFPINTSLYKVGVTLGDLNTWSMKEMKLFLGSVYHRYANKTLADV